MRHPDLDIQARVPNDIDRILDFVHRQPWGNRLARETDLRNSIFGILERPELNEVGLRRRTGVELRRQNIAQFAIIYAYYRPSPGHPNGLVSIRAVRHSRTKDVFRGVREMPLSPYGL